MNYRSRILLSVVMYMCVYVSVRVCVLASQSTTSDVLQVLLIFFFF